MARKLGEATTLQPPTMTYRKELPREFFCPLSLEIMQDPVLTEVGSCYERANIEKWLRSRRTDPMTNLILPSPLLVPNRALRALIQQALESSS